ncbi:PH domain-containing protein [Mycolicibacterium sediminis]|uniref:Low molecular weight protein antigen 6 PH domain-containing protein n=1 Tax=Mycolicibacterium sediminis TaxID=1286180 RepID=A0A7I7QNV3_9MYCO|nr:PH domain-containing protein [Mycolicibacterium sediminis]BBY28068.1 hypothetical protein MSEDJ_21640 [Mycolicibacterium sediminis]
MTVQPLAKPPGWKANRRLLWAFVVAVPVFGFIGYAGVQAASRGSYLTAFVIVGWVAPLLLAVVAAAWRAAVPTSLRVTVHADGTMFRSDIRTVVLLAIGCVLFVPAGLLYVILVPSGRLDLPMSRGFQLFSPIVMAFAVVTLIGGIVSGVRRRGIGYLRVGPSGVEYADILTTTFAAWADVEDLTDTADKRAHAVATLELRDDRRLVLNGLTSYVPGGGLYWMIRHYWRHPQDRAELVDARALDRLRHGRFEVEVGE